MYVDWWYFRRHYKYLCWPSGVHTRTGTSSGWSWRRRRSPERRAWRGLSAVQVTQWSQRAAQWAGDLVMLCVLPVVCGRGWRAGWV